jgi:hypothetical protein
MNQKERAYVAEKARLWDGPYAWGFIAGYRLDLAAVRAFPPLALSGFT